LPQALTARDAVISPRDIEALIRSSRVYDVARKTALDAMGELSHRTGNHVLLKREDEQVSFSFKVRGAYNKMAHLSKEQLSRGVVTSSAGNHAQGVARAASVLACDATIVMPVSTPEVKVDAVRRFGGKRVTIVLHGESYSDAHAHATTLVREESRTFVHPFDDPHVIAGQGTIAKEILEQHPAEIDAIFVAVGGGGLAAGIGSWVRSARPATRVIGVQAEGSSAMMRSLHEQERVRLDHVSLFSDGTAVKEVGALTMALCSQVLDDLVVVSTDEICAAISDVYADTRHLVEPAGALSLAGLKKVAASSGWVDRRLVAVACGANMNFNRLRFVAERAEVGRHREAIFAVTIPEERGSFRALCRLLGNHDVTEFNYRMSDGDEAHILVGIETRSEEDREAMASVFRTAGLSALDLSDDELAKTHLRHMVGGRSESAKEELLYRFEFPERPGALMRFLSGIPSQWNISLFHYRGIGADYGDVLVGIQTARKDRVVLESYLSEVGFPFRFESDNPAYQLFL